MKLIAVYRVDYVRKILVPIGKIEERRLKDRGDNLLGLLHLARKKYSTGPEDAIHIAVDIRGTRACLHGGGGSWTRSRPDKGIAGMG